MFILSAVLILFTVCCLNCQTASNTNYNEILIQIPQECKGTKCGLRDWQGPEMVADYFVGGNYI